jgi:hypothetical protein
VTKLAAVTDMMVSKRWKIILICRYYNRIGKLRESAMWYLELASI